jgi:GxxExxY protein
LRLDVLVEDVIIVELKAMDGILPVHEAQLLTYMKLLQKPKGILINFNCTNIFKEGQKTLVNEYYSTLPA